VPFCKGIPDNHRTVMFEGNREAGLEAALRPAAMEEEIHLPLQASPIRDLKGMVIVVNGHVRGSGPVIETRR
jgi:hypothetical protein